MKLPDRFDPHRTDDRDPSRVLMAPVYIDSSPGDMTRYRLTVTEDPYGGLNVISNIGPSLWRTTRREGDFVELVASATARHRDGGPSLDYDRTALTAILDALVRRPAAKVCVEGPKQAIVEAVEAAVRYLAAGEAGARVWRDGHLYIDSGGVVTSVVITLVREPT